MSQYISFIRAIKSKVSFHRKVIQALLSLLCVTLLLTTQLSSPFIQLIDGSSDSSLLTYLRSNLSPNDRRGVEESTPFINKPNDWRQAAGSHKRELFLYSAYLDLRNQTSQVIRVFTISKNELQNVNCIHWLNETDSRLHIGHVNVFYDYGKPYTHSPSYVICPVDDPQTPPTRVGLTTNENLISSYEDAVPLQLLTGHKHVATMNACIKPMWNNFDNAAQLVEFVEMFKLLGVNKFIFYNDSVSDPVNSLLHYYINEGTAEVLPYTLPLRSRVDVHTESLQTSLNDCVYRSIGRYNFTVMVDMDEILMPFEDVTLVQLVQRGNFDAYAFNNVFFYRHWPKDWSAYFPSSYPDSLAKELFSEGKGPPVLLSQTHFMRAAKPNEYHYRSKYILRPERAVVASVHYLVESVGTQSITVVPNHIGLSFHYRYCEKDLYSCNERTIKVDNTTRRFNPRILLNAKAVCTKVFPDQYTCPGNKDTQIPEHSLFEDSKTFNGSVNSVL